MFRGDGGKRKRRGRKRGEYPYLSSGARCTGVLGRSRSWRCRTIGHPGIALHLLNLPLPFLGLLEQKAPKDLPAMLAKFKKSNVKIDRTLMRVTASERQLVALATLTVIPQG